jgi:hypothetical protein
MPLDKPFRLGSIIVFDDQFDYREVLADLKKKTVCKKYKFMIFDLLLKEEAE